MILRNIKAKWKISYSEQRDSVYMFRFMDIYTAVKEKHRRCKFRLPSHICTNFKPRCHGHQPPLVPDASTSAKEALTAPLVDRSGFILMSHNVSGLLMNILLRPFVKFVRFFGKEMQDLSLDRSVFCLLWNRAAYLASGRRRVNAISIGRAKYYAQIYFCNLVEINYWGRLSHSLHP